MGVVYDAWDDERSSRVALKVLSRATPGGIYRFKNEFRSLSDVSHPNLAALYELASVDETWFLTMELVEGVDFLRWVRAGWDPREADTVQSDPSGEPVDESGDDIEHSAIRRAKRGCDIDRLRDCLRQLAAGVGALHDAGFLHRDLKPSNVLVRNDGQVKVLDFGLIRDEHALHRSLDENIVGTPAYMAPEQAAGGEAGPAADWYAVGVMLYEAMTGVLPYEGTVLQVIAHKQHRDPPHPGALVEGLPSDLTDLAMDLLRRDPAERPAEQEIRERLEACAPGQEVVGAGAAPPPIPFVGREQQLAMLRDSYEETRLGEPAVVHVRGLSGSGKTALVRHFLDELHAEQEAVLLTGRCYERESVPFKALDSAIDDLSRYLRSLEPKDVTELLPADIAALARVFPVLHRVPAVRVVPEQSIPDALELRQRAFGALRELLARIADRHGLVLFVDDLQWGDADSAELVEELLRPPDAPAMLLLAAYREDEQTQSPPIERLRAPRAWSRDDVVQRELPVGHLSREEAQRLASALLGDGSEPARRARTLAQESEGNPLLLSELARFVRERAEATESVGAIRLVDVLRRRIEGLEEAPRRLLEAISVAGGPIAPAVAANAAELETDVQGLVATLRAAHFVRSGRSRGEQTLETWHDRIRETVVGDLSTEALAAWHARLADALSASGNVDPERLAVHLDAAGEAAAAARYAAKAADHASSTLAFDRAARLYRTALRLREPDAPGRGALEASLAEALAHGGRSAEAADAYLHAAEHTEDEQKALDLRRRAAEHLMRSGHVDRGLDVMRTVLESVGMRLAATPRRALASLLWQRSRIGMRGLGFEEKDASEVPEEALQRIDTCWSVAVGLGMVDFIRGADFQARHLRLALEGGEPYRVARALALEAAHVASRGPKGYGRASELLDRTYGLAQRLENHHAMGVVEMSRAANAMLATHWREAAQRAEEADRTLRERCSNVAWERATTLRFRIVGLCYLGQLAELAELVPERTADAERRGDLYARECARSGAASVAWLAMDRPETARAQLEESRGLWSERGFQLQHYLILHGLTFVDLYEGHPQHALTRLQEQWAAMEASLLLRIYVLRLFMWTHRGICAAAAAPRADEPGKLLAIAERDARRLEGQSVPVARAFGALVRAGLTSRQGRDEQTLARLEDAEQQLDAVDMALGAAAARHRRGELLGGDEGRALVDSAQRFLDAQGVRKPEAMLRTVLPELD